MAVDADTFDTRFPEFAGRPDDLLEASLEAARGRTHATTWGTSRDEGILYLTAELLARSPFGREMRMVLKNETTAYTKTLRELRIAATIGRR
jgi:hypothetical protein